MRLVVEQGAGAVVAARGGGEHVVGGAGAPARGEPGADGDSLERAEGPSAAAAGRCRRTAVCPTSPRRAARAAQQRAAHAIPMPTPVPTPMNARSATRRTWCSASAARLRSFLSTTGTPSASSSSRRSGAPVSPAAAGDQAGEAVVCAGMPGTPTPAARTWSQASPARCGDEPLAPARGQSLDGLLALLERLDGVEEAAVVRSALAAGVPRERVLDELQHEVERRLARGRRARRVSSLSDGRRRRQPRAHGAPAASSTAPSAASSRSPGPRRRRSCTARSPTTSRGSSRATAATPRSSPTRARCSATCGCSTSGDELLLDTERVGAAGAVQHDPALQARPRRRAAQAHAGARRAVAHRAGRAARRGRRGPRRGARQRAAARSRGVRCVLVATDVGVDVFCAGRARRRGARRARAPAPGGRGGRRDAARRARPAALRRRPRRRRSRRRPGSTSARCRSPRAATSARRRSPGCYYRGKPNRHLRGLRLSAPAATGDALRLGESRSGGSGRVAVSPVTGRSRSRSCAARRRPATRSRSATAT